jgi:hypothetical protein
LLSSFIYFVADYYPWWGLPLALIFAEQANKSRRYRDHKKAVLYGCFSMGFLFLAVAYFMFNGFEKLRPAMQQLESMFFGK